MPIDPHGPAAPTAPSAPAPATSSTAPSTTHWTTHSTKPSNASAGRATPTDTPVRAWLRGSVVEATMLSFVAAYIDAVGFIALFGLFTSHLTGNFVMIGVELVGADQGVLTKILAVPVFAVAAGLTTLLVMHRKRKHRPAVRLLLLTQAALVTAFMVLGLAMLPHASANAPLTMLAGLVAVAALGVQNATAHLVLPDLAPTTAMTNTVTQIVIDVVQWLAPDGDAEAMAARKRRLRKMVPALFGFAAGALLGAFAYVGLSFWCVLLPIAILGVLAAGAE